MPAALRAVRSIRRRPAGPPMPLSPQRPNSVPEPEPVAPEPEPVAPEPEPVAPEPEPVAPEPEPVRGVAAHAAVLRSTALDPLAPERGGKRGKKNRRD